mmetsp:Transcript_58265/g.103450  ORF Transcript_58265/g.103450 Transcript_58265/m.103450 type:complete len:296 (-) Transcript_58265:154-1041(-)|eukprot:CAMPEP_0197659574 /NCGR_PEP_ID=MMETSP1338-20131121/48190_1 /TAXON_ID=43686 ORGANISM="Pelagodinium beii, Strain RCC1491" /NCGR_SAMPLE_ID=MMETSP1338 /ASSEMBLY_ACC=CAM_ASM_000754 /LENGTH=295 /DNA_ID=CAMNT_0043236563 /DNA_START=33 /DNA_END=920 /DNA_ORIENTATION=+
MTLPRLSKSFQGALLLALLRAFPASKITVLDLDEEFSEGIGLLQVGSFHKVKTKEHRHAYNINIVGSVATENIFRLQTERANASNSIKELGLMGRLEYELNMDAEALPAKNKLVLAVINMFGLGCCGIDRCYMGQTWLGVAKGLTLGGLLIWTSLDWLCITITCLSFSKHINAIGMHGTFSDEWNTSAFIFTIVILILGLGGSRRVRRPPPATKEMTPALVLAACLVFDKNKNNSGKLTKEELKQGLMEYMVERGGACSEQDLDTFIAQAEVDKDGYLDYTEFAARLEEVKAAGR